MQKKSINQLDLEVASACCAGDRQAQWTLFERVKQPMFGVCLRFCDSRQAAEDLLQEGFIRVFRDICKYRGEGSLEGWVRRIFIRVGIEYYQRQKSLPEIVELDWLENEIIQNDVPIDPDDPSSLIQLIQQLPIGFRAVLNLAVLEEKSHEEIARELGIAVSTSRSQLTRAKAFLKKILQKTLILI